MNNIRTTQNILRNILLLIIVVTGLYRGNLSKLSNICTHIVNQ